MNQSEFTDFLQYLASDEFQLTLSIIAAIAGFLIVLAIVYSFLRRRGKYAVVADELPVASLKPPAAKMPRDTTPQDSAAKTPRHVIPQDPAAKTPRHTAPQDSVLRRHYVTHVRYMIETLTFPCPTDSVLRRHYDHLITSELEACLGDDAQMERLISRYEEHRRSARS